MLRILKVMTTKRFSVETPRLVGRHSFVQAGSRWVEAAVINTPDAPRQSVQYDSPEFFKLLERHPKAVHALTVGRNLELLLDGIVYEIHE